jgi:cytidylate kinase
MGTRVFPSAILKFFLDADPNIRAARRYMQLKQSGVDGTLRKSINELSERDLRDSQRVIAPLKPAADAIIIDTTTMTINEVFAIVANQVDLIV